MPRRARADAREADPAPVSQAMNDLIVQRGWSRNIALGKLKANWGQIVGPQVAARSEPIKLEHGRLTIRVEGGAWAAELALLAGGLAEASAHFLGPDLVREVAVVAGTIRRSEDPSPGSV